MERQVSKKIGNLIAKSSLKDTKYTLKKCLKSKELSTLHPWLEGKNNDGGYLICETNICLWLTLVEWNQRKPNNFYLVVFDEIAKSPILEIHRTLDNFTLNWKYQPSKRDGANESRKEIFSEYNGSINCNIRIPTEIDDLIPFLDDVFRVYQARIHADNLDINYESVLIYENDCLENDEFFEGRKILQAHFKRERNPKLIKATKARMLDLHGELKCQCCGFNFHEVYGELGKNYIEVHHTLPLNETEEKGIITKIEDMAIVCSNCHRMLHRKKPTLHIDELKNILAK